MCAERILILSNQPLFAQGVRALIQAHAAATTVRVEPCDENAAAVMQALHPEVVILEDAQDSPPALVLTILDALPSVRLIRLSLDRNTMRVYAGQQHIANNAQDLVQILHSPLDPEIA